MKSHLSFVIYAAAAQAAVIHPMADPPAGGAQQPTPAAPWAAPPTNVGNALAQGLALYNYLSKTVTEVKADYDKGVPIPEIVDRTIPKILPEAKLHTRVEVHPEQKHLKPGSKFGKAAFGPYTLVGKNVRLSL
jgi:hypothetical protein